MNISYWEQDVFLKRADVIVIGAGLVGLHAAWRLKELEPSLRVVVLEAGPRPGRASLRNAGFACFGSPSELLDDLSSRTEEEVAALIERRLMGLAKLRTGLGDAAIGYQNTPSHEVFSAEQQALAEQCLDRLGDLNRMLRGIPIGREKTCLFSTTTDIPPGTSGFTHAIHIQGEGQIHPGKMMKALSTKCVEIGVEIHYGCPVETIHHDNNGYVIELKNGAHFPSQKVLITTNGFTQDLVPELNVSPARNQVLVTEPIPNFQLKGNFHAREGYVYFRSVGQRLLIGGFRDLDKKGETTSAPGFSKEIQNALHSYIDKHLLSPGSWKVAQRWSGTLGVGAAKSPIIDELKPGLWCAVRLGGMGVALGAGVGHEVAERMLKN